MVFFFKEKAISFHPGTKMYSCQHPTSPWNQAAIEGLEVFTFDTTSTHESLPEHKYRLLFKINTTSALHKFAMLLNQPGMDMHQSSHNWYCVQELLLDVYSSLASARSK